MKSTNYTNSKLNEINSGMENSLKQIVIYKTPRFEVIRDTIQCGNTSQDFYYVRKPNAVSVIVVANGLIGLLKIKRHLIPQITYEIIGGRIENNENPLIAAKRELLEEVGIVTEDFTLISETYPLPSVTTEKVFIYVANVINTESIKIESHEGIIEFQFYSKNQVLELIRELNVNCSIDAYALLFYFTFTSNEEVILL